MTDPTGIGMTWEGTARSRSAAARGKRPAWWRRPWVGPLTAVCVLFVAISAPPYFVFDHTRPPISFRPGIESLHYGLVAAHISFGTVALLACCLQVWPWFRKRSPVAHRRVGRVYVFLGVLPGGLLGIVVSSLHTEGLNAQVGNLVLCVLWLYTAWAGYRAGQARRFGEHRKWMIRSFALCTSIVANRLWIGITIGIASLDTTYVDEHAMVQSAVGAAIWLSWVVNLLIAEWWLQYRGKKPLRRAATPSRREPANTSAPRTPPRPSPADVSPNEATVPDAMAPVLRARRGR